MTYPINSGHYQDKRTIIVPPTTDMALVFPFDHENKRFDKNFYSPFLTDGKASSEQIEHFLKQIEEAFKEKVKWVHRLKAYLIYSFLTGILLMVTFALTIFSGIDDDYNYSDYNYQHNNAHNKIHNNKNFRHHNRRREVDIEDQVDIMFMGWIFLCFAALIWGIVFRCLRKSSIKNARKSVQEVIDRHYHLFANSGLRWNLPLAFPHYIELWKDYKGQNFSQVNNQIAYNVNPLSFNQIQNQLLNQNQRYPNLNTVSDQCARLDFQNNSVISPLLNNHAQRSEVNSYVPPHPNN